MSGLSRRARPAALIGLVVSICAFGLLFWLLDARSVLAALAELSAVWLLPASAFVLAGWAAQARRWAATLPDPPLGTPRLTRLILIGLFGNLILPLRAGDLVRVALTARALGGRAGAALASVAIDRAMDVLTLLLFGAFAAIFVPLPAGWRGALATLALGALAAGVVALGIAARPGVGSRLIAAVSPARLRPGLTAQFGQLADGVRALADPSTAASVVAWSLAQWALNGAAIWCCLLAFDATSSGFAALSFMVATSLGSALPSAPSAAGVYHAVGVAALAALGVEPERALAIALVAHAHSVVLQLGAGAVAVWVEGAAAALRAPAPLSEG